MDTEQGNEKDQPEKGTDNDQPQGIRDIEKARGVPVAAKHGHTGDQEGWQNRTPLRNTPHSLSGGNPE
jgi:hypothetical protein